MNQNWMRTTSASRGTNYASYSYEQIKFVGEGEGITSQIIDPIDCGEVDPRIILLSGRFTKKTSDWKKTDYDNGNNHSVVIKVVFGQSSFLFTGDLETKGLEKLMSLYDNGVLDVDILRVGHHGAANATTPGYLNVVTPSFGIISCGKWTFGRNGGATSQLIVMGIQG
jgi:hypothetical protein